MCLALEALGQKSAVKHVKAGDLPRLYDYSPWPSV